MPIKLRPLDKIVAKWRERASTATPEYVYGIQNPKISWSAAATAAKDAWRAGVTDAAGRDAYAKGVAKAGDAKWAKKALEIGQRRYPEGIGVAVEDYKSGWAPYYDALSKIDLPPRGPRGDPRNIERVATIVKTLRSLKLSM